MPAVTTSTSPRRRAHYRLRLIDKSSGSSCDYSLHVGRDRLNRLDEIAFEGSVHEKHEYEVALLSSSETSFFAVSMFVNDDDCVQLRANSVDVAVRGEDGEEYNYCQLIPYGAGTVSFARAYGFVSLRFQLESEDGRLLELFTSNIACACDKEDRERIVSDMLTELSSDKPSMAMDWMLSPRQSSSSDFSLHDSGSVFDGAKTLRSFLRLCDEALEVYEKYLPLFQSRPHSAILKRAEVVGTDKVRRFDRGELDWLSKNADVLYEVERKTPIVICGTSYMALRVQTERSYKSFDTMENRAILSFLREITKTLIEAASQAGDRIEKLEEVSVRLNAVRANEGVFPALVIIESCLRKEKPLVAQATGLADRSKALSRLLSDALPNVRKVAFRVPKRSKVFQEVMPYFDIHAQMRKWDAFGEFNMLRDELILHAWKMDKLYEYYALYRLLDSLCDIGFTPDTSFDAPMSQVHYTPSYSSYYRNERQIANIYRLARGAERLVLFYEPVVFANNLVENGMDIHRTTKTEGGSDSCWTPDYILCYSRRGKTTKIVLDAKFSTAASVFYSRQRRNDGMTEFEHCMLKYKLSMMSADGKPIDSLWLLCGRESAPKLLRFQNASWAASQRTFIPDGVFAVAPGAGKLDPLLDILGIESLTSDSEGKQRIAFEAQDNSSSEDDTQQTEDLKKMTEVTLSTSPRVLANRNSGMPDDVMGMICTVIDGVVDKNGLFDSAFARRTFGIDYPLLKTRRPSGRDQRKYTADAIEVNGKKCFIFSAWRPNNINRLKRTAERFGRAIDES